MSDKISSVSTLTEIGKQIEVYVQVLEKTCLPTKIPYQHSHQRSMKGGKTQLTVHIQSAVLDENATLLKQSRTPPNFYMLSSHLL